MSIWLYKYISHYCISKMFETISKKLKYISEYIFQRGLHTVVLVGPYFLYTYFFFFSIFNANVQGFMTILGSILAIIVSVIASNALNSYDRHSIKNDICLFNAHSIGGVLTRMASSITLYSFILSYLLYISLSLNILLFNIFPIIFVGLLTISDMVWQKMHGCISSVQMLSAVISGIIVGVVWGAIATNSKSLDLFYTTGSQEVSSCSVPSKIIIKRKSTS